MLSKVLVGVSDVPKQHYHLCHLLSLAPGKAFLVYWWMQHFGGLTAKRHLGISNAETVGELDLGKLARSVQKKLASSKSKSATTYKSKAGHKAFAGSRFLKDTG